MGKGLRQKFKEVYQGHPRTALERQKPVRIILNIALPLALVFSAMNFLGDKQMLACIELAVALFLLLPIYLLLQKIKTINLCENLMMVAAFVVFAAILITGGKGGVGSNWIFIFPFLAFYINEQKQAWNWIVLFWGGIAAHAALSAAGKMQAFYSAEQLHLYLITFIFYAFIAYVFNSLRNNYEHQLEQSVLEQTKQLKLSMKELEHKAMYDALTDLPNRYLFEDRLRHAIQISERETTHLCVVAIDLSRFQEVNNIMGHDKGDAVLKQMGERLSHLLRASDTAARIGGDTFALILPKTDAETVHAVTRKVFMAMDEPFVVDGFAIEMSLNVGVAVAPLHGSQAEVILQRADLAMRQAKQNQIGKAVLYDQQQDPYSFRRLNLFGKLRKAIEQNALSLVYQPKVRLDGNRKGSEAVEVEALLRWIDPEDGFIAPDEFIPLAEQTGIINTVSEWVLRNVVQQISDWKKSGLNISVAVNLSPRDLLNSTLPDHIESLLSSYDLDSSDLCIEVTETALMTNPTMALDVLTRLSDMGLCLSIDDFGTGYSSLSYLKLLPVHELKIDRCFIKDIMESSTDAMIVKSTVELAHALGLVVVAEGVETKGILQVLESDGVDKVQGYYFCKPLPAEGLQSWLLEQG